MRELPPKIVLDEEMTKARRIVCAAILHKTNGVIICGARHHDCLHHPLRVGRADDYDQGFIDQFNLFLTREDAHKIAKRQGQIVRRCGGDICALFSENLY